MDSDRPSRQPNWHAIIGTAVVLGTAVVSLLAGMVVIGIRIGEMTGEVKRLNESNAQLLAVVERLENKVNSISLKRSEYRDDIASLKVTTENHEQRIAAVEKRKH